ncbi:dihydrofolate reductase family protein [Nocardioides sp. AE5]|uniref:dihydrofolate reductase family protein n=1 Tax=Nocardioides sp. AE5 TaxID=2962573 RepID=UPI0028818A26|nr:dihydrofolate reductase family protein [Nocardioides sp. AE5]MDT0203825.1 dihydrofolate reductase family protein [Nocardioides sp. AE5]
MSRNVTAHLFSSLNGVSESPHLFQFDAFGEEEGRRMAESLAPVSDVVIGRKLWQEWRDYWTSDAGSGDGFGDFINPVRKHVVSATLDGELDWNSTLVDGDPIPYVADLKAGEGGDIAVAGGVETVRSLFLGGVVDVLTLTMHPAVTGAGRRLFDESVPLTRLELVDSGTSPLGNVFLTYRLKGAA